MDRLALINRLLIMAGQASAIMDHTWPLSGVGVGDLHSTLENKPSSMSDTDRVWDHTILNGVHCGNRCGGRDTWAIAVADALADELGMAPLTKEEVEKADKLSGGSTFSVQYRDARKVRSSQGTLHPQNPHILMLGDEVARFSEYGGYPIYYITKDCAALCGPCVKENIDRCAGGDPECLDDDQWLVVAHEANYEDTQLHCVHCGKRIESAYGED